jgi:hypothetical protein
VKLKHPYILSNRLSEEREKKKKLEGTVQEG